MFPDTRFPKKQNYQDAARATGTAKNVQSFDEITIMSEAPAIAAPWVTRNTPNPDYSGSVTVKDLTAAADGATPQRLDILDDAVNLRADNQILTRATPDSSKDNRDNRPTFKRRSYQDGVT